VQLVLSTLLKVTPSIGPLPLVAMATGNAPSVSVCAPVLLNWMVTTSLLCPLINGMYAIGFGVTLICPWFALKAGLLQLQAGPSANELRKSASAPLRTDDVMNSPLRAGRKPRPQISSVPVSTPQLIGQWAECAGRSAIKIGRWTTD
jgi:hypothetical protein